MEIKKRLGFIVSSICELESSQFSDNLLQWNQKPPFVWLDRRDLVHKDGSNNISRDSLVYETFFRHFSYHKTWLLLKKERGLCYNQDV